MYTKIFTAKIQGQVKLSWRRKFSPIHFHLLSIISPKIIKFLTKFHTKRAICLSTIPLLCSEKCKYQLLNFYSPGKKLSTLTCFFVKKPTKTGNLSLKCSHYFWNFSVDKDLNNRRKYKQELGNTLCNKSNTKNRLLLKTRRRVFFLVFSLQLVCGA